MPQSGRWYPSLVNYAQLLFPDFSLMLCGYLVCRYTALDRPVWEKVESLVYYFLFPVALFHAIVKSPLNLGAASPLILAAWTMSLAGIALAYSLPRWPGLRQHIDKREHAAMAQIGFRFNTFIALALADRLAGAPGLALMALLAGVCIPLYNVAAVWPMARASGSGTAGALLRNPFIIATVSGLAANLLGFTLPTWLEAPVGRIGASALALGLLSAGAGLQLGALSNSKVLATSVLGIRHLAMPLVAFALCHLFGLGGVTATVLMLFSAMPTSPNAYVLASRMGYNGAQVAGLITLSTLLGLLSLPFALGVLMPRLALQAG